jgi:uncharacterized protein (TIGR02270 family)
MSLELFEEHFGEATFLWHQREHALISPRHTSDDTAALEWRLLRHVDGMVLTGVRTAERKLIPLLEDGDSEASAVATLVLLDPEVQRPEPVLSLLRKGEPTSRVAISQALRARPSGELEVPLRQMMEVGPPALQALLLDVLSDWRCLPLPLVEQFLTSGEPEVRAAALRAARALPEPPRVPLILDCLSSEDASVQREAVLTGLIQGVDGAWRACLQQAARHEPGSAFARLLLALGGDAHERALLHEMLATPEPVALRQQTLWALGFSGSREAAAACLPLLSSQEPLIERLAGEAFSAITGLRLEGDLTARQVEDETGDDTLSLTDSWLPRPRADAVENWWRQNHSRFSSGVRYLGGAPCTPERLLVAFEQGAMRRRTAIALELILRSRGSWVPPLRAFMVDQQRELAKLRSQASHLKEAPFAALARSGRPAQPPPAKPVAASRYATATPGPGTPVVTAMGMVSSLALGVAASCAAATAGLVHAMELEGCEAMDPVDGQSYPVRGHCVAGLTQGFTGLGRLARLGVLALGELKGLGLADGTCRTGLYVALPSGAHERAHKRMLEADEPLEEDEPAPRTPASFESSRIAEELLPLLARLTGLHIAREYQRVFSGDAVGFLHALAQAQQALHEGRLDRCILGGIDSLVAPQRLEALKALGLLKIPGQPSRMLPGEAAAFLVLERQRDARQRGAQVLAICEGIRGATHPPGTWEGAAKAGRNLAGHLAGTLASLADGGRHPGRIIGGLNGHDRRAYAWGHALPIVGPHPFGSLPLWSPAESFGELGAATGPVAICMAVRDFARGITASPHSLVWLMGDEGDSGSFHVTAALRERLPAGERT